MLHKNHEIDNANVQDVFATFFHEKIIDLNSKEEVSPTVYNTRKRFFVWTFFMSHYRQILHLIFILIIKNQIILVNLIHP